MFATNLGKCFLPFKFLNLFLNFRILDKGLRNALVLIIMLIQLRRKLNKHIYGSRKFLNVKSIFLLGKYSGVSN